MIVKYIDTLEYYDGTLVFTAKGNAKFICTLIDREEDHDTYVCLEVSDKEMAAFQHGRDDILTIYRGGNLYRTYIDDIIVDDNTQIDLEKVSYLDVKGDWFPESQVEMG